MLLDELPKSARIEDRRGVTVARGGIGVGTIVVLGLIGWALGIDPRLLIGGAEMMSRSGGPQSRRTPVQQQVLEAHRTQWASSWRPSSEVQRRCGPTISRKLDKPTNRRRWLCSRAQRSPAVDLRKKRWGRSIARSIKRFISTPVSFRTSNGALVLATLAARLANSHKRT